MGCWKKDLNGFWDFRNSFNRFVVSLNFSPQIFFLKAKKIVFPGQVHKKRINFKITLIGGRFETGFYLLDGFPRVTGVGDSIKRLNTGSLKSRRKSNGSGGGHRGSSRMSGEKTFTRIMDSVWIKNTSFPIWENTSFSS